MEDRVHRGCHIVLVVVGGDADILIVEFQREGVLRLAQTTMAAVEAHHFHQIVGEGLLLCYRVLLMQELSSICGFSPIFWMRGTSPSRNVAKKLSSIFLSTPRSYSFSRAS